MEDKKEWYDVRATLEFILQVKASSPAEAMTIAETRPTSSFHCPDDHPVIESATLSEDPPEDEDTEEEDAGDEPEV